MFTSLVLAKEARFDGKTPSLEPHQISKNAVNSGANIRLEIAEKKSTDASLQNQGSKDNNNLSIGRSQKVSLEIKITNISRETTKPMKVIYEIFGRQRNTKSGHIKFGDHFSVGEGEIKVEDSLKFMDSKVVLTNPVDFQSQRTWRGVGASTVNRPDAYEVAGNQYDGYIVQVYDESGRLLTEKAK